MKYTDIKLLWGRSGNRCAVCKFELTPSGSASTLGEMAHIVAASPEGPRGMSDLTNDQREAYENRILLCPNDHKIIDNDSDKWAVEKLHSIKADHEKWVNARLEEGNISLKQIDNENFINLRKKEWCEYRFPSVWIISSITPLDIVEDLINPLEKNYFDAINSAELPRSIYEAISVNEYHTRSNENGLINEDFRLINAGYGHRIQVFRNGHCEFMICLDGAYTKFNNSSKRGLHYKPMAESFVKEINGLINIWCNCLPFNDLLLTNVITNTKGMGIYFGRGLNNEEILSHLVEGSKLEYQQIIDREIDQESVTTSVLKRFVSYFGLRLETLYDERGNFAKPKPFHV